MAAREHGSNKARKQGSKEARKHGSEKAKKRCKEARKHGCNRAREQRSQEAGDQGSKEARRQESKKAREPRSKEAWTPNEGSKEAFYLFGKVEKSAKTLPERRSIGPRRRQRRCGACGPSRRRQHLPVVSSVSARRFLCQPWHEFSLAPRSRQALPTGSAITVGCAPLKEGGRAARGWPELARAISLLRLLLLLLLCCC